MSTSRRYHGIGILDGVMYAIGGDSQEHSNSVYLKSVEAYTPTANVWSPIADMHLSRYNPSKYNNYNLKKIFLMNLLKLNRIFNIGVVTFNGLLYVMGGFDGSTRLDSMEIYDPNTNTWTMEPFPTSGDEIYGAVVIDMPSHLRSY